MVTDFILASQSPRRLSLLKQAGYVPQNIIPADIDEVVLHKESPKAYVSRMSLAKASYVHNLHPESNVLAADTIVFCQGKIIGKPADENQARAILQKLSGRGHKVISSVTLYHKSGSVSSKIVTSIVKFKSLSIEEITTYLQSNEWQDKAGGYAIQGQGSAFVRYISGSYSNIVGLPLFETINLLKGYKE